MGRSRLCFMTRPIPTVADLLAASGLDDTRGRRVVLRRDFSNVVYLVAKDVSAAAARALATHYNDLKHHQTYWADDPWFETRRYEPGDILPAPP